MIAINRKAEGHGSSHVTMDRVPPPDEIGAVRRILGDAFPADLRWTVDCLRARGIAPSRTLLIAHGGPGIVPLVFAQELRVRTISVCRNERRADASRRRIGTQRGSDLVDLRIAQGVRLPAKDGAVDAVRCEATLPLESDPSVLLRELHRVTRAGGIGFFGELIARPGWHLPAAIVEVMRTQKLDLQPMLATEVEQLLVETGFSIQQVDARAESTALIRSKVQRALGALKLARRFIDPVRFGIDADQVQSGLLAIDGALEDSDLMWTTWQTERI